MYDSLNVSGITLLNEPRGKQIKIWIKNKDFKLTKSALDPDFERLLPSDAELIMIPFDILMLKHIRKVASNILDMINISKPIECQPKVKSSRNVCRKKYFYK